MSDPQNVAPEEGAQAQAAQQALFQLQKIYVKDASFELPSAPQIFREQSQAEIKMNVGQRVNPIEDGVFEVILSVTVTASSGDKTAYLAEVHQAGLFAIAGLNEGQRQVVLNTLCPSTLFPYAARVITTMVGDGGFPPLVLQPINFDQVFQQRVQEARAKATQAATEMPVQGNA